MEKKSFPSVYYNSISHYNDINGITISPKKVLYHCKYGFVIVIIKIHQ